MDSLQEGGLLCKLLVLDIQVSPDREAMLDTTVEVDLIADACLRKYNLGFMSLLGWEDAVGGSGSNGDWPLNGCQLLCGYE